METKIICRELCEKHDMIIRQTRYGLYCPKCLADAGYMEEHDTANSNKTAWKKALAFAEAEKQKQKEIKPKKIVCDDWEIEGEKVFFYFNTKKVDEAEVYDIVASWINISCEVLV